MYYLKHRSYSDGVSLCLYKTGKNGDGSESYAWQEFNGVKTVGTLAVFNKQELWAALRYKPDDMNVIRHCRARRGPLTTK